MEPSPANRPVPRASLPLPQRLQGINPAWGSSFKKMPFSHSGQKVFISIKPQNYRLNHRSSSRTTEARLKNYLFGSAIQNNKILIGVLNKDPPRGLQSTIKDNLKKIILTVPLWFQRNPWLKDKTYFTTSPLRGPQRYGYKKTLLIPFFKTSTLKLIRRPNRHSLNLR